MDNEERKAQVSRSVFEDIKEVISQAKADIAIDPGKSILYAKTALLTAQENKMETEELDCLLLLANGYTQLFQYKEALDYAHKAELFIESSNQPRKHEALILIGEILEAENKSEKALEIYQKALEEIKETKQENRFHGLLLHKIATLQYGFKNYKLAKEYYNELLNWTEKNSDRLLMASTLINLGILYNKTSAHDQALSYFLRSLSIYKELDDLDGIISNQINLGLLYWRRYQYDKSLEYLKDAQENVTKTVDKDLMFEVLNNLGMIYRNLQQYEQADNCQKEALKIIQTKLPTTNAKEENKLTYTAGARLNSLLNLITAYMNMDAKESAREVVNEAVDLLSQVDNKALIKETYKIISEFYHKIDEYKEAYDHYKKYIKISEEIHAEKQTLKFANVELDHEISKIQEKTENRLKLAKTSAALAMAITASHEVNQPLMIIVGNLELLQESLKDKDISEKEKAYMQNIKMSVGRITKILEKFQNTRDIQFQDYNEVSDEMVVYEEEES